MSSLQACIKPLIGACGETVRVQVMFDANKAATEAYQKLEQCYSGILITYLCNIYSSSLQE